MSLRLRTWRVVTLVVAAALAAALAWQLGPSPSSDVAFAQVQGVGGNNGNGPGTPPGNPNPGNPPGNGTFTIRDAAGGPAASGLAPGISTTLQLVVENPYSFTIRVTDLDVDVTGVTGNAGPCGPGNVSSPGLHTPFDVGRQSSHSVQVPISMVADPEDGCQGATFELSYSGQGRNAIVENTPPGRNR